MAINYDRTKVVLLTTCQEIKISINNKTLQHVNAEKLLGIVVDQNLPLNQHNDKVHKTIGRYVPCSL